MKIVFVLENYYPYIGGAEILFRNLCEGLAARGHNITVITTRHPGTPGNELLNRVHVMRIATPRKAARYWFTLLAVSSAIWLAGKADIVHTTTYNGAFPAWIAARLRHKRCAITVLEIIGDNWKYMPGMGPLKAWLHRLLERRIISLGFDRYVAISKYTADCLELAGTDTGKISVVYPGIDYDLFNPSMADRESVRKQLGIGNEFIYLYYGRPGISKGVEYLVEAVPLISQTVANSRLLMLLANEPSDGYARVKELITRLGIQDSVIMVDPVPRDQLPSYIAAADCAVVPSLSEGFGFSAVEACAMDVPVVASNVASLPEVISGKHVLVEPKSSSAIALGVEAVYNNQASFVEKKIFKWSDCVDRYEKLDGLLTGAAEGEVR